MEAAQPFLERNRHQGNFPRLSHVGVTGHLEILTHSSLVAGEICDLARPRDLQRAHCGLFHKDFRYLECLKASIHRTFRNQLFMTAWGREAIRLRRAGYLGKGIHVAPSMEEKHQTVDLVPFSGCMQSSQALLKHTGGKMEPGEAEAKPMKGTCLCSGPLSSQPPTSEDKSLGYLWLLNPH